MPLGNGKYTFVNVQYDPSSLNLYESHLVGPVTGFQTGPAQEWDVTAKGNFVTVSQIVADSKRSYVHPANTPTPDTGLEGSQNTYQWVINEVPGQTDKYYFTTADGAYSWYLASIGDYAVVVLKKTAALDPASQWVVTKVVT